MNTQEISQKNLVFKCITGSYAYGTQIEGVSDKDTRGVFIAPPEIILSCRHNIEQVETPNKDETIFEIRKFFKLAGDANPNILDILFADNQNILHLHPVFQKVLDKKDLFLSRKARFTFSGYAMSQLKRIKGHRKWINNSQPIEKPQLSHFVKVINNNGSITTDHKQIIEMSANHFLAATFGENIYRIYSSSSFSKNCFFDKEQINMKYIDIVQEILDEKATYHGVLIVNMNEYRKAMTAWKQYWQWKNKRNESRAKLEEQFGFDTKNAMHLVRLMKMCKEILTEQKVVIRRPDAKELLDIRDGKFNYDELIKWSEEFDKELDDLYEKSSLQHSPNWDKIDELYRQVISDFWKCKSIKIS